MKILLIASGSSVHTKNWLEGLVMLGYKASLAYNKGDDSLIQTLLPEIDCFELPYSGLQGYFLNAREVEKICRSHNFDVVFAHYLSGYGTLAAFAKCKPLIISVYGSDIYEFPKRSKIHRALIIRNLKQADCILSSSNIMKKEIEKYTKGQIIEVIPFGIDIDKFFPRENVQEKVIVGNIKTLSNIYAIDILIEAFEILIKEYLDQNLQLHIYGDGPEKQSLQRLIESKNLQDHAFLLGAVSHDQVPEKLAEFTIFCATSRTESFGVSALEAMAMQKPSVLTDCPGFLEISDGGRVAKIVPKDSPQEIASAIRELLENEDDAKEMGKAAREHVLMNYNWKNNLLDFQKIIERQKKRYEEHLNS